MITPARRSDQSYAPGVSRTWLTAVVRLTALLAGVGLATSRLGLIVHELVGHGATALVLGGHIHDVTLFWFAGGWVHTELDDPTRPAVHAVLMGGIAVEIVIGTALWLILKRADSLARRIVRACGATLVAHGAFYAAAGAFHGFGDGVFLHQELGDARVPFAIVFGMLACLAAFVGARLVLAALAAAIPGTTRMRIAGLAAAVAIAGGVELAAGVAEVRARRDATYGAIMKPENQRVAERELAEWARQQAAHGHRISDDEREARARELADAHRQFPFALVLGGCLVAAIGAGAVRSRAPANVAIGSRLLVIAGAVAVGSLAAVIAIDLGFH